MTLQVLSAKAEASLRSWSAGRLWAATLALTAAIAWGEVFTGADVVFTSLYFLPIAFGGWFRGRALANTVAAVATLTALVVDLSAHGQRSVSLHVWNLVSHAGVYFAFAALVPGARAALRQESLRSLLDPATGLLTRSGFLQLGERETLRARRTGRPISVVYLRLLGPSPGLAVGKVPAEAPALELVGQVLRGAVRAPDLAGHLESDAFAMVLADTSLAGATLVANRVTALVASLESRQGIELPCAAGVRCFICPPASLETMLGAARESARRSDAGRRREGREALGKPA
jgi:GGDEF domain-containing protein